MSVNPVDQSLWASKLKSFRRAYERQRLLDRLSVQRREEKAEELAMLQAFFRFAGSLEGMVLDIGCGDGFYREMIPEAEYVGVDPLAWEGRPSFPFSTAMGEALPFRSGYFDHVLIVTSLDHAQDPAQFLVEGKRVLKPGGRLALLCGLEGQGGGVSKTVRWQRVHKEGAKALLRGAITRFYRFVFGADDTHPYVFNEAEVRELMYGLFPDYTSQNYSPNILFLKGQAA